VENGTMESNFHHFLLLNFRTIENKRWKTFSFTREGHFQELCHFHASFCFNFIRFWVWKIADHFVFNFTWEIYLLSILRIIVEFYFMHAMKT
jgi:hypothetical protein